MRVLHVITTVDPNAGGPPAVALRLAAAQAGLGASATIATYRHPAADERVAKSLSVVPGIERVGWVHFPPPGGTIEKVLGLRVGEGLRQAILNADVLHLHGVWDTILRVASREAAVARRPYTITPHGMLDPWCLGNTPAKRFKKHAALTLAYRAMINGAAFIHVLNRDERDLMAPLGFRPPCEVIPNGVFLDEMANLPASGAFRAAHPELGQDPFILFLSRVHHKKGLDYLVDAFASVLKSRAQTRLVVAGPDDGALQPMLAQARSLGVHERVHAVGPLYGRDKLSAFVDAAVFCLPSRQEGFSMAVTEALACGVPAVISDQCHFPEVAEAGAGLVTPLDAGAVAMALLELLKDDARRGSMGRAGAALVRERYTWPAIARQSLDAYARHGRLSPEAAR